jgi:citrate synthase
MNRPPAIRSDISWSTPDRIVVRGLDLSSEILGHMDIGAMSFLQITGRRPTDQEARVYNAMIVTLIEHGMTPSAIAARLTYAGAPESLQAAVAAGIAGLGTVFVGSMEGAARMLAEALPDGAANGRDLHEIARGLVAAHRQSGQVLPGFGHPLHKPIDPRTPRLLEIAAETGFDGPSVELVQLIGDEATSAYGKPLPVNATGVIGALCCELGFPWQVVRGFGVMARAIGLVGHLMEEREHPTAMEIWRRTEAEASAHARVHEGSA